MVTGDCTTPVNETLSGSLLPIAVSTVTAGQPLAVHLNSSNMFGAVLCMNMGWHATLQGPDSTTNIFSQDMQPWQKEGAAYLWRFQIPGASLTLVGTLHVHRCMHACFLLPTTRTMHANRMAVIAVQCAAGEMLLP
jgi:hypothetical protein